MLRPAVLVLLALMATACDGGYPTVPDTPASSLSIQCTRTLRENVVEQITATTSENDGKANWVPTCTQSNASNIMWWCPAPPQAWWSSDGAQGEIICYVSPCNGLNPKYVWWYRYPGGSEVHPKQAPSTLPKSESDSEPTPQIGNDACLNVQNGWKFAPPQ